MPFPVKDWKDDPNATTPLSAAALEDLEARLAAYTNSLAGPSFLFSQATATIGSSGTVRAKADGTVTRVNLSVVGAPVGSAMTVAFKKNGTTFATLSVPAGTTTAQSSTSSLPTFVVGDLFSVEATSIGSTTAATGVVAQMDTTLS
jgi:hypothetical protein